MAMKLYSDSDVQDIADSIRNLNNYVFNNGYTRIEYIQSDGNQYIDMGFKANQDTKILLDFQQTEIISSARWFFGARQSSSAANFGFLVGSDTYYATPYNSGAGSQTFRTSGGSSVPNDALRHILIKQRLNDNTNKMGTFDGVDIFSTIAGTNYSQFETPYNVVLFAAVGAGGGVVPGAACKIYECKVWIDGSTLTRDFIPCRRNSDNEIGMYDLVNNVFYTNEGTGSFTGGSEYPKYKIADMSTAIDNIRNNI